MCYEKRDPEQARACFERDQRKGTYIDREALVHHFMTTRQYLTKDLVMDAAYEVSKFPAADVAPVVRCKNCKHYQYGVLFTGIKFCCRQKNEDGEPVRYIRDDYDFCSYGERKDGEG